MGNHFCHLNTNGRVKCWGFNSFGQLGQGDAIDRGAEANQMGVNLTFVQLGAGLIADNICVGSTHSCAHFTNNGVKCWGDGGSGRLGTGDLSNRGDESNEMGDKLPLINIGTQSSASKVICGGGYTCILFANKKVKCFGMSYYGQTGYELSMTKGTTSNDMGDNLPFVPLGSGVEVESIFAYNSGNHNCVILATSSSMICWGLNNYGQLGTGDQTNRGYAAGTMGDNLATIDLGTTSTVKTIGVGYSFTCALRTDDVLLCFGDNSNGQLGIGASTTPIKDMGVLLTPTSYGSGKKIRQIIGGNSHLCVLFDDNLTLKCIGGNGSGQLGQGDTLSRGAILPTTIPNIPAISWNWYSSNFISQNHSKYKLWISN